MSLYCCCNLKWRFSRTKTNCNSLGIKSNSQYAKVEIPCDGSVKKIDIDCAEKLDNIISSNEPVEPQVIMRKEPVRQKVMENSSENISESKKLDEYRNNGLKSVFHKSIRFDEHSIDNSTTYLIKRQNSIHKQFVASSRRGSLYVFRNAEDVIITPFAQILASLRKIRANFMLITNITSSNDKRSKIDPANTCNREDVQISRASNKNLAQETLNELEWCLDRLENIQTHRSVSDMASTKFKQIINRELSQFADKSKCGHQISDYICKTFLDSEMDDSIQDSSHFDNENERKHSENEIKKQNAGLVKLHLETMNSNQHRNNTDLLNNSALIGEAPVLEEPEWLEMALPSIGVSLPNEEEISRILDEDLNKWGMNIFSFGEITEDQPLTVISYAIFKQLNLISIFQIDEKILLQFLLRAERAYHQTVPYHNNKHAADVTQSVNVLLGSPALDNVFSDLELLSVIFASIIHDMDHPGVTNQYLINTNSDLATLYNDNSVLENHHLSMAFSLLGRDECNFLRNLNKRQRQSMRRMVIDMVLATDMSKHMGLLADLKTMVETKKVAGSGILTLDTYTDRIQILQNLIHCADLSNPTKPLHLYQNWTNRVMEEFYLQGDKERENNLEFSPMCDRQTSSLEKSQVSFIDFIVHPLWETWSELVYPDTQGMLEALEENRRFYFNKSQEYPK